MYDMGMKRKSHYIRNDQIEFLATLQSSESESIRLAIDLLKVRIDKLRNLSTSKSPSKGGEVHGKSNNGKSGY